jgi:hypothetical protein
MGRRDGWAATRAAHFAFLVRFRVFVFFVLVVFCFSRGWLVW